MVFDAWSGFSETMPYLLDTATRVIRLTLTGHLSLDELRDLMQELRTFEQTCPRVPHRLTDLTGLEDSSLTMDQMRQLVAVRLEDAFPNRFRSAIVAPQQFQFGYARMFQTLNTHPDIRVGVFTTVSEAMAWLQSPGVDS